MKIMRLNEVRESTGLARSTIYMYMSEDRFPKPAPLGSRAVGWVDSEIQLWIKERIDLRDSKTKH